MKIYLFAVLLVIAVLNSTGANAEKKEEVSAREYRSYARTVVMELDCKFACPQNITWKYRKQGENVWNDINNVTQHRERKNLYHLRGFMPNNLYEIQVLVGENNYTSKKPLQTCGDHPPDLTELYVASSGTGWFDIRWTQPKEKCKSEIKYMLRYKAMDHKNTKEYQYGFFEVPKSHGGPTPYHPCVAWPQEFCALLTDHVQPGKKHVVQVRALRLDPDNPDDLPASKWKNVIVFADATYYENNLPDKCNMALKGVVETPRTYPKDGLALQLWVVAFAGILIAIAVVIALCAAKKAWMSVAVSPASCATCSMSHQAPLASDQSDVYDYPRLRLRSLRLTRTNRHSGNVPLYMNRISEG